MSGQELFDRVKNASIALDEKDRILKRVERRFRRMIKRGTAKIEEIQLRMEQGK